ncbi:MAG: M42 family metallopeptidase [Oscillospiraceae bacterium]|nr:M42 family metallopeptidase [Oscillospiraceae bacterium]
MNIELLKKLTECFSPSGREDRIRDIIKAEVEPYVTDVWTDALGNLICHKKGPGKKLMMAAHMDEIGFMVTHIEDSGFLRFVNVGGISAYNCINRAVVFENGTVGVISYENKEKAASAGLSQMYIDIGAKDKAEAEEKVEIGSMAGYKGELSLMGELATSKTMDDRVGCFVLIEAIKAAKESPNELFAVFTVQEEVGLRGAKTSAFAVEPDMGFAIDVSMTGDTPESSFASLSLGKGPGIKLKDASFIINPAARDFAIKAARVAEIPYQLEAAAYGGTDAGAINLTRGGVPAGTISVPTRYIHSPQEVVSLSDVENSITLVTKMIETAI